MKFNEKEAKKAARFVHERTRELAAEYGFTQYEDFPLWEDLPEGVQALATQIIAELVANLMIGYDAPVHGLN
jgi:hypothetical protein